MKKEVKIRYSPEEIKEIKKRAKLFNKSPADYQKQITKKAEVRIEVKDENF